MTHSLRSIDFEICISDNQPIDVLLSILVAFGLLISFFPQVRKIIKYKTSEGISPWFLMLGTMSATCILFNIVILQFKVIKCCQFDPVITCFENMLGIIQLAILWFMCMVILVLFMLYFPSHRKLAPYIRHLHYNTPPTEWSIEWRNSIIAAIAVTIHIILTIVITILLLLFYGHKDVNWTKIWADSLGIMSMLLMSIQSIPQLYRTWKRKSVGALSIEMMIMQVLGSFIFVYTLSKRTSTSWTTWIVFFVSGCLQGILLIMCICWHYRSKRLGHGPFYVGETDQLLSRDGRPLLPDERTTLINKAHKRNPSHRPSTSRGSSFNSTVGTPNKDITVNNNNNNNNNDDDDNNNYLSVKF
ncbi:hypothetical protein C1645_695548 [Glomus cerebriforme]|uniref:PQ loop repeat-domain-containing protein n=1 Tax=Glomus cerebriforme TaxID=658196 RepID=A0A397SST2_9GLOM|nr:hypothetical protein C1645_695548 [Glomus cerebriforme]